MKFTLGRVRGMAAEGATIRMPSSDEARGVSMLCIANVALIFLVLFLFETFRLFGTYTMGHSKTPTYKYGVSLFLLHVFTFPITNLLQE